MLVLQTFSGPISVTMPPLYRESAWEEWCLYVCPSVCLSV